MSSPWEPSLLYKIRFNIYLPLAFMFSCWSLYFWLSHRLPLWNNSPLISFVLLAPLISSSLTSLFSLDISKNKSYATPHSAILCNLLPFLPSSDQKFSSGHIVRYLQSIFPTQYQRQCFTPIQNCRQNCAFIFWYIPKVRQRTLSKQQFDLPLLGINTVKTAVARQSLHQSRLQQWKDRGRASAVKL